MKNEAQETQSLSPVQPNEQAQPVAFLMPAGLFNEVLRYIGRGTYFEVNTLMNVLKTQAQPMYSQATETAGSN